MRKPRVVAVLPTLLTLANAACGFAAVTVAAKVQTVGLGEVPLDAMDAAAGRHLFVAAGLIFLAMVFDAFDGSAARLLGQSSELGAQLDSLCDALSFGVAPAFLMLQLADHTFAGQADLAWAWPGRILWGCAVLFVLCTILRLARFNVETDEEDDHAFFRGLPSPAAAAVVASVPLVTGALNEIVAGERGRFDWSDEVAGWCLIAIKLGLPVVTLAAAGLMVSRDQIPARRQPGRSRQTQPVVRGEGGLRRRRRDRVPGVGDPADRLLVRVQPPGPGDVADARPPPFITRSVSEGRGGRRPRVVVTPKADDARGPCGPSLADASGYDFVATRVPRVRPPGLRSIYEIAADRGGRDTRDGCGHERTIPVARGCVYGLRLDTPYTSPGDNFVATCVPRVPPPPGSAADFRFSRATPCGGHPGRVWPRAVAEPSRGTAGPSSSTWWLHPPPARRRRRRRGGRNAPARARPPG